MHILFAAVILSLVVDGWVNPGINTRLNSCEICALCVEDLSYIHDGDPTSCLDSCVACEGNPVAITYCVSDTGSFTITIGTE